MDMQILFVLWAVHPWHILAWLSCHRLSTSFIRFVSFSLSSSRTSLFSAYPFVAVCLWAIYNSLNAKYPSCICANLVPLWFLSTASNDVNIVSNRFSFVLWMVLCASASAYMCQCVCTSVIHLFICFLYSTKHHFRYNPRKLAISCY